MPYTQIQYAVEAGVATITLNRPDKFNSFTGVMHEELRAALTVIEHDSAVRALILTGAGKGFCSGQDLADPAVRFTPGETPPDLGEVVRLHYRPLIEQLTRLRVPTVCALNGVAAGAGASLALVCDMVLAAQSASLMLPFAKIGLIPDTACTWIIPQRIGLARALGLAMTGEKISAQQAENWGLIWKCLDDAQLLPSARRLAQQLAALPTEALIRTRALMLAAHTHALSEHLEAEAQAMSELGRSPNYVEGVSAFLQKRAPLFNQSGGGA